VIARANSIAATTGHRSIAPARRAWTCAPLWRCTNGLRSARDRWRRQLLLISEDLDGRMALADRIGVMSAGRIIL